MTLSGLIRKERRQAEREKWERMLDFQLNAIGLPELERQFIVPGSEMLANKPFDRRIPGTCILIEIDGGTLMKTGYGRSGGHAHPDRMDEDNAKRNLARVLGWTVLQVTGRQVQDGTALSLLEMVFEMAGEKA